VCGRVTVAQHEHVRALQQRAVLTSFVDRTVASQVPQLLHEIRYQNTLAHVAQELARAEALAKLLGKSARDRAELQICREGVLKVLDRRIR